METKRCLYEILGVQRTATADEIRSAYRKLALKWHPDKIQQSGASPEECQEATIQFQEIGRAYEVLSDAAERSWYDSHRSQILSSSSSSSSDYDFNPWPYFSASVYSGYGDTGKGFYAVYGELFTKLHQQEQAFARSHGLRSPYYPPDMGGPDTDYSQVQKFYNHWLGFSTLKDFSWCDEYHAAAGPNRKLRRLMEEENKKIRSKHRKEFNETIRRLAAFVRKRDKRVLERQLEVQKLEKEREEMLKQRRKKEEEEKRMKAKLYREAEWTKVSPEEYDVDEGSDVDDSIGSYGWTSSAAKRGDNKSKKNAHDEFFCIVCNKKFKSDKQWKNHERSKKHVERAAALKESFREEDEAMSLLENETAHASQHETKGDSTKQGTAVYTEGSEGSDVDDETELRSDHVNSNLTPEENGSSNEDLDTQDDDELQGLLSMIGAYKTRNRGIIAEESDEKILEEKKQDNEENKQNKEEDKEDEDEGEEEENTGEDEDDEAELLSAMLRSTKGRAQEDDEEDEEKEEEEDEEEEHLAAMLHNTKGKSRKQTKPNKKYNEDDDLETGDHDDFGTLDSNTKSKMSRSKLRNEKKLIANNNRHSSLAEEISLAKDVDKLVDECSALAVKEENQELENRTDDANLISNIENCKQNKNKGINKVNAQVIAQIDQSKKTTKAKKGKGKAKNSSNTCDTCGEDFESRNQLFKHISITKHAILKGK